MPSVDLGLADGQSIGRLIVFPIDVPSGSPTGSITRPMAEASVKLPSSQQTMRWGRHWVRHWHRRHASYYYRLGLEPELLVLVRTAFLDHYCLL